MKAIVLKYGTPDVLNKKLCARQHLGIWKY